MCGLIDQLFRIISAFHCAGETLRLRVSQDFWNILIRAAATFLCQSFDSALELFCEEAEKHEVGEALGTVPDALQKNRRCPASAKLNGL